MCTKECTWKQMNIQLQCIDIEVTLSQILTWAIRYFAKGASNYLPPWRYMKSVLCCQSHVIWLYLSHEFKVMPHFSLCNQLWYSMWYNATVIPGNKQLLSCSYCIFHTIHGHIPLPNNQHCMTSRQWYNKQLAVAI